MSPPIPQAAEQCAVCGLEVDATREPLLYRVGSRAVHSDCLHCGTCERGLVDDTSCFLRDGRLLCRDDFYKCAF